MHKSVMEFVERVAFPTGSVCELGSYNVNGSVRELWKCRHYVGIDTRPGPGVDVVADVTNGCLDVMSGLFDVVVSTETLEHVKYWNRFLNRCKMFVGTGGTLVLTARGPGFPRHCQPDHWRFSTDFMRECLSDFQCEIVDDPQAPGFLAVGVKPPGWVPADYGDAEKVSSAARS